MNSACKDQQYISAVNETMQILNIESTAELVN